MSRRSIARVLLGVSLQLGCGRAEEAPRPVTAPERGPGRRLLAAGGDHTCASDVFGEVVACWGGGDEQGARLDDATSPGGWRKLAVEQSSVCGLTNDGRVRCDPRPFFAASVELDIPPAVDIAAGRGSGCAALGEEVACWRFPDQPGDQPLWPPQPKIVPVAGIRELAVSDHHVGCGRSAEGEVKCWELDGGCLGTRVAGLPAAVQLVGGGEFCARGQGGDVWCWSGSACEPSGAVRRVSGLGEVVQIAGGSHQSCARHADGTVACWSTGASRAVTQIGVERAQDLAVGRAHACMRNESLHVACWGRNAERQLGDPADVTVVPQPREVEGIQSAVQLAGSKTWTCAVLGDGHVRCWGLAAGHARGDGSTPEERAWDGVPWEVGTLEGAVEIAPFGPSEMCARLQDGEVRCWSGREPPHPRSFSRAGVRRLHGSGSERILCAEFANGVAECLTPSSLRGARVNYQDHAQIAVCDGLVCTVDRGGDTRCDPHTPDGAGRRFRLTPSETLTCGGENVCALDEAGRIHCWGVLAEGDAVRGEDAPAGEREWLARFERVEAAELSQSLGHACVRSTEGTVRCWGGEQSDWRNTPEPPVVPGITDARQVAVMPGHVCTVHRSGRVRCWGRNELGQAGAGSGADRTAPFVRLQSAF